MNELIYWLLVMIGTIIIHELGHYIGFRIFKMKPKFKITWIGISCGAKIYHRLKPLQFFVVLWMGILSGYFFLMVFDPHINLLFFYLLISSIDIYNIMWIMSLKKESIDKPLIWTYKKEIDEMED